MQKCALLFFIFLGFLLKASHNRSGEIVYKRVAPYTKVVANGTVQAYWYSIRVIIYTDDDTQPLNSPLNNDIADHCFDSLYFGDGTFAIGERTNGGSPVCPGCKPCACANCGELIINENGYRVKKNIYEFLHEYPAAGYYHIRSSDPNRNADVINMTSSEQQPFYIESLLVINSFTGPNSSPEFKVDPVDKACLFKCFTHNPGAYDPDQDSLSYKISVPKRAYGIAVTGYSDPDTGPGGTFNIDPRTGILTWCSPQAVGEYNIAFLVQEWRRNTSGTFQVVGTVLRDMQVVVRDCPNNDPPGVLVPKDTCVEAGTFIQKKIYVSDPNSTNVVTLSGYSGAFSAPHPTASLTNTSGNGFYAGFSWQTTCEHVSRQYYRSTFKVEDDAGAGKLANYAVYGIRVVPSPVKDVVATPLGTTMKISWAPSGCNPKSNPLIAYKIYRKEGCDAFIYAPCQAGVPASSGFVLIGETNGFTSFFMDTNNGEGLIVGQNYSYVLVALYKDGSESFGSSSVCAKLKRDVPVILNVDVLSTSVSAGAIAIRWGLPLTSPGNLDTVAFPGPYRLDLRHKKAGIYSIIFSSTAALVSELATTYTHSLINTTLDSNRYYIEFTTTNTVIIGTSQKATSVFLSAVGSDRKVDLSWKSKTPWKNYTYTVFRKAPSSNVFAAIATTTMSAYSDKNNIVNKNTYCYYVLAEGEYSDPSITRPLINASEEVCATALDLTAPCTPTLSVDADCPSGFVNVKWKNVRPICSDDVVDYLLFYKSTIDEPYQKVFETDSTFYVYDGDSLISGCYAIQARDSAGNLSIMSPDFCIDNCPEFELPNVFTPNGDGVNDFFKAVKVRQVKEIGLVISDRWGNLVYKTKNPYFQWDGISQQSEQALSEGTFLYVCHIYEPRVKGLVKRVLKGTVQLIR